MGAKTFVILAVMVAVALAIPQYPFVFYAAKPGHYYVNPGSHQTPMGPMLLRNDKISGLSPIGVNPVHDPMVMMISGTEKEMDYTPIMEDAGRAVQTKTVTFTSTVVSATVTTVTSFTTSANTTTG